MTELIRRNRALPWILLFCLFGVVNVQIGGTNVASRMSGLRALTEGHTLNTDLYHNWSSDWSLSPNGHYYPNKAPGSVLLGLPVFALIDYPTRWLRNDATDSLGRSPPPDLTELLLFSLLMQLIPYALLVLYVCRRFETEIGDAAAVHFFALAALFGNTAALYMSVYFGHALAATLLLAAFVAWLRGRYAAAGALLGATLLTDYGAACVIPFFLAASVWRESSFRPLRPIVIGSLPFAALWTWYHTVAFGSPFALAIKYSNPQMIESVEGGSVWGMYGLFPSLHVLGKLLFGPERGLLYTQPWMLAVFPLVFARTRLPRGTKLIFAGGLGALLWMNASVGGWQGGWCLGPRYLCLLFPSAALALALAWRELSRPWHTLLVIGLGVSLAFRILVLPYSVVAPEENLWAYHLYLYSRPPELLQDPFPLLALALAGFAVAGAWVWRRERKRAEAVTAP